MRLMLAVLPGVLAASLAGAGTVRQVGELGRPERLTFHGVHAYPVEVIRRALEADMDFQRAATPTAPLADYIKTVRKQVRAGYRRWGFPNARVELQADATVGELKVTVTEGRRYASGEVRVTGGRNVARDELVRRLTKPHTLTRKTLTHGDAQGKGAPSEVRQGSENVQPVWVPGHPAPMAERSIKWLTRAVRESLKEMGYFFPDVGVEVVKGMDGRTAHLVVVIRDEGPKGIIEKIEVKGLERIPRKALLAYLELKPGMAFSPQALDRVRKRLEGSARFKRVLVELVPPEQEAAGLTLRIELAEVSQAPPLGRALSEEEAALQKLGEWLSKFPESGLDLVLPHASTGPFGLSFILSPGRGYLVQLTMPALGRAPPDRITWVAGMGRVGVYVNGLRRQWTASAGRFQFGVELSVNRDPSAHPGPSCQACPTAESDPVMFEGPADHHTALRQ